jgi:protein phosphatase
MTDPNQPKAGGLWARLFSVQEEAEQPTETKEAAPEPAPVVEAAPADHDTNGTAPVVEEAVVVEEVAVVVEEETVVPAEVADEPEVVEPIAEEAVGEAEPVEIVEPELTAPQPCDACGAIRQHGAAFCHDCGYMFPANGTAPRAAAATNAPSPRESTMAATSSGAVLQNRFEVGALICDRQGVLRQRGVDRTTGQPVVIVSSQIPEVALAEAAPVAVVAEDEIMPGFDDEIPVATPVGAAEDAWPSIAWEKGLLANANHPALPTVIAEFSENGTDYLVLESPTGASLWDAWDDPDSTATIRYGWLQQIAAALQGLHAGGAIFEGVRPDVVVIDDAGQPRFTDISDVLPCPVPPNAPIKATLYTAPELILSPTSADLRADLYSFGAMLYSLEYLHHPLEEKDFERQFMPLQITERFPDVHPLFLRLINKTFVRDPNTRFPTDEMTKTDPSGCTELIRTLGIAGKAFDEVRLDIAAWTTTGMVRTGNEDALTVLHGVDTRQDELGEYAMVLLCDGMGGYDAGEVAAAMCLNEMRKYLLAQPMFAALTGGQGPKDAIDPKKYQEVLRDALKHANKEVYTAGRTPGRGKRGMGCTAEAVYIDSRHVIAGHVGDSRVYHVHRGRLIQLTRDQTLVNRLVELGQLTAAEAEDHPRKNELQQAIGGQPDVNPGLYSGKLMRGDWVLVCSDGLTNHISNKELETMLTREAANSAEEAARRLLNLVNLRGATDNATIVVVRAS